MKKILMLTDFSEASRHALSFAQVLFTNTSADFNLLSHLKELVILKGASLTLLIIETLENSIIYSDQELRIRQFLSPVEPTVARLQASSAKAGIDACLAGHPVDLLVTIPRYKSIANVMGSLGNSHTHIRAYTPLVPLLTLYTDSRNDFSTIIDESSTLAVGL